MMSINRKFIVFDLDGTLIDSFPFYLANVKIILSRRGRSLNEDELPHCLGLPASKFFEKALGKHLAVEALRELKTLSMSAIPKIKIFSGISSLLSSLRNEDKKIALWTSRDQFTTNLVLESTGLLKYFDFIVSGCCVESHKPNPEGLTKIATYFSCEPSDIIVIGDHEFDVQAAKAVNAYGIRACWHNFMAPVACEYARELCNDISSLSQRLSGEKMSGESICHTAR